MSKPPVKAPPAEKIEYVVVPPMGVIGEVAQLSKTEGEEKTGDCYLQDYGKLSLLSEADLKKMTSSLKGRLLSTLHLNARATYQDILKAVRYNSSEAMKSLQNYTSYDHIKARSYKYDAESLVAAAFNCECRVDYFGVATLLGVDLMPFLSKYAAYLSGNVFYCLSYLQNYLKKRLSGEPQQALIKIIDDLATDPATRAVSIVILLEKNGKKALPIVNNYFSNITNAGEANLSLVEKSVLAHGEFSSGFLSDEQALTIAFLVKSDCDLEKLELKDGDFREIVSIAKQRGILVAKHLSHLPVEERIQYFENLSPSEQLNLADQFHDFVAANTDVSSTERIVKLVNTVYDAIKKIRPTITPETREEIEKKITYALNRLVISLADPYSVTVIAKVQQKDLLAVTKTVLSLLENLETVKAYLQHYRNADDASPEDIKSFEQNLNKFYEELAEKLKEAREYDDKINVFDILAAHLEKILAEVEKVPSKYLEANGSRIVALLEILIRTEKTLQQSEKLTQLRKAYLGIQASQRP